MLCLCLAEAALSFVALGPVLRRADSPALAARFEDPPSMPPFPAAIAAAACEGARGRPVQMMAVAAPPRAKSTSTAVTRRGGGQLISWYFKSISSTRLLTAEQEQQLSRMIIAGEEYERAREELAEELMRQPTVEEWAERVELSVRELRKRMRRTNSARDLMVAANMRLVVSIVRPYLAPNAVAGGALSMEDLVQEGSLGLLKAVSRFRPERGHRFSTYATWWIRTTVQRAVADQARTIRLPFGKSRMLSKAKRLYDTLQQQHGRRPTEDELASGLDVPVSQLRVLMQHWHGVGSLEAPISSRGPSASGGGRQSTLLDAYRSRPQQQRTPEDSVEVTLVSDCLKELCVHPWLHTPHPSVLSPSLDPSSSPLPHSRRCPLPHHAVEPLHAHSSPCGLVTPAPFLPRTPSSAGSRTSSRHSKRRCYRSATGWAMAPLSRGSKSLRVVICPRSRRSSPKAALSASCASSAPCGSCSRFATTRSGSSSDECRPVSASVLAERVRQEMRAAEMCRGKESEGQHTDTHRRRRGDFGLGMAVRLVWGLRTVQRWHERSVFVGAWRGGQLQFVCSV